MAGSPIFRRITLTEVKKTSNKRGSLLKELAGLVEEERDIIKNHHDPSYSNWRSSFLREEGMTTDGFMQTQLKAEGDTDLATIAGNVEASYQAYEGGSDALSNTAITSSGTGSGTDGGFDLGKDYLGFNGNETPRFAALKPIDASKFDTIVVTGIRGNDTNGGEDPDATDEDLMVYYQLPGQNTIQRLDVNGGVTQSGIDYKIIPVGSDDSGLQEYSLTLPSYTRAENVRFILYQPSHSGTGFDNYGITQINYRRVKPISVMVSLDSPEASAFIRVGSPSKATESKKKREQQLREQLEATKDYTDKKFGENFPGSEVAAPGEEDPTEVEKKAPGLGEFEPEVVDYNTWKQETKAEDPQAKTTPKEFEKWKDEKALKAVVKSFTSLRDSQQELAADLAQDDEFADVANDIKQDAENDPELKGDEKKSFEDLQSDQQERVVQNIEKNADKIIDGFIDNNEVEDIDVDETLTSNFGLPQKFAKAGTTFFDYLTGRLPAVIDNDYLGKEYVKNILSKGYLMDGKDGIFKSATQKNPATFMGGDNIVGTGQVPEYDPETGMVTIKFNYDFKKNLDEVGGRTDNFLSNLVKGKLLDYTFGSYGIDASPKFGNIPVVSAAIGNILGQITGRMVDTAKGLGAAKHTPGEIKISADELQDLNRGLYNQLFGQNGVHVEIGPKADIFSVEATKERLLDKFKNAKDVNEKINLLFKPGIVDEDSDFIKEIMDDYFKIYDNLLKDNKELFDRKGVGNPAADASYADYKALQAKNDADIEKQRAALAKKFPDPFDVTPNIDNYVLKGAKSTEYKPAYAKELKRINDAETANNKAEKEWYNKNHKPAASGKGGYKDILSATELQDQRQQKIGDLLIKTDEDFIKSLEDGKLKLQEPEEFDFDMDFEDQWGAINDAIDGTQIAATYGKGSKKSDWFADFEKQVKDFNDRIDPAQDPFSRKGTGMGDRWKGSQVPQQDFGSIAQTYGGQGVDAATLASTAAATQAKKKKKKTTVTASYKPKGSMITEKKKLKSPSQWFNPDDIKPEYPKDPPPEMVNNYHPNLVDSSKKAERFNKLDPASAKAMPKQDDPNIDAKVEKAKNNPDKDGPQWHKQVSDKIRMARAQQRKG